MTKTRLEAFSDAVIAIIMTIMVLELPVPGGHDWNAIVSVWPKLLVYVISFVNLGIYWGNHHHLVHTIHTVKAGMIWANIHLLFWLSLLPWATAWAGESHFEKIPVAFYAILADLSGIAYYIFLLVIKACDPHNEATQLILKKQQRKGTISCILYTISIPLAFVNTIFSGALIIIVAVWWMIPDRNIERKIGNGQ